MEVRVLGPVSVVHDDGSSVVMRSTQQRLVLALLIAARGRIVSTDVLAEALWSDDLPSDPAGALQSHVSRLRRQLGRAALWIETASTGYRSTCPPEALDASRFEALLTEARGLTDDSSEAAERLDAALSLWRGRAYGEFSDHPAVASDAIRLEELRAEAAELRAECLVKLDRASEAATAMRALVDEHPFRERPVAVLMRALASDGRHAEALDALERFRRLLDDELGLEPSPELRTVEAEILRHDQPSRSLIGVPGNSFVGRDTELAKTTWLLERHRLVTLTGAGGVGKTRMALHVAAGVAADYPDGVYLCELARVSDPDAVNAAVASTLHVEEQADRPLAERLIEFLQTKQTLLVLDNCEHVLEAAGRLITAILLRTPDVDVLATSRERLGVEGEERVVVGPLATPAWDDPTGPSVVLFSDRARAVNPDLRLDEADIGTVSELCRRLDGLPLAIELAAAQTVWSSPSEILIAISDRLSDLSDQRRTVVRHRSLEAVFGWSYELLSERERLVFEQLSVFSAGWTADAAASVVDASPSHLSMLVERSLINAVPSGRGRTRFSMLEPIRQYATDRLAQRDLTTDARARHAAWAIAFAESADAAICGPDEIEWLRALDDEHANLRVALRWCLDNDAVGSIRLAGSFYHYIRRGAPSEVFTWAAQSVTRFLRRSHPRLSAAYAAAALGSALSGDLATARAFAEAGFASAIDPRDARLAWTALGDVENFLGNFEQAVPLYDRAIDLAREAGDRYQMAASLCDRAMSLAYLGCFDEAIETCEALAPIVAAVNNPTLTAYADYTNGEVRVDHAPLEALVFLRRSVVAARRIGDRLITGLAGLTAVSCEARVGDQTKALVQYGDLIDHWHRAGVWNMQWATLRTLVELLTRLGRDEEATTLYGAMTASPTAPPVAGADAVRIGEAVNGLRSRLGDERFDALRAEGAELSDNAAVAFALRCVGGQGPLAAEVPS